MGKFVDEEGKTLVDYPPDPEEEFEEDDTIDELTDNDEDDE